jgi:outer membrane protein
MKKLVSVLVVMVLFLSVSNSFAQGKVKLGHLDFATLYSAMPGLDSVKTIFDEYNKSIQDQNAVMQSELESKFQEYQASVGTMSDIIRATKEAEINDLKARLDAFQQKASTDLQNKEAELTAPIIEKAQKAVEEVAKENGFTYIFNSTEGLLLYSDPSDDIMDLVKTKLGIAE